VVHPTSAFGRIGSLKLSTICKRQRRLGCPLKRHYPPRRVLVPESRDAHQMIPLGCSSPPQSNQSSCVVCQLAKTQKRCFFVSLLRAHIFQSTYAFFCPADGRDLCYGSVHRAQVDACVPSFCCVLDCDANHREIDALCDNQCDIQPFSLHQ